MLARILCEVRGRSTPGRPEAGPTQAPRQLSAYLPWVVSAVRRREADHAGRAETLKQTHWRGMGKQRRMGGSSRLSPRNLAPPGRKESRRLGETDDKSGRIPWTS